MSDTGAKTELDRSKSASAGGALEKTWYEHYEPGISKTIDPSQYEHLVALVEESFKQYSERRAYSCMGKALSFKEVDQLSEQFACYLQQDLKLKEGDRVAIMMPNLLQYPICLFGILRAGMTVVNVNPLYTARELEHQLKDSGAKAIVVVDNFAKTVQETIKNVNLDKVVITRIGDMLGGMKGSLVNFVIKYVKKMVPAYDIPNAISLHKCLAKGSGKKITPSSLSHESIAFLQYTGGTTGVSKGAMLTHRTIISNVLQADAWLANETNGGDVAIPIVTALPLYHIFSLTANCLTFLRLGGENILVTNPRDIPGFIKILKANKFGAITGVNTLFNALINHSSIGEVDFSEMRFALGGGMAVQESVATKWQKVTGKPIIQAYGLTETSPAVCINPLNTPTFNGTIGVPISSTDITIRDDDDQDLGYDKEGELCIKGPQVMKGYWQREDENKKVFSPSGWLRTGDIAKMSERGYVTIVDRKKDMILVSGFNVYPNEVEEIISNCPGVLEVAALGQANEKSGEVVKVFVVKKDQGLTAEDIIAYSRKYLTSYKVPKYVEFRDELPKTNVGKILRRALRDS